jgi:hypothetical protein
VHSPPPLHAASNSPSMFLRSPTCLPVSEKLFSASFAPSGSLRFNRSLQSAQSGYSSASTPDSRHPTPRHPNRPSPSPIILLRQYPIPPATLLLSRAKQRRLAQDQLISPAHRIDLVIVTSQPLSGAGPRPADPGREWQAARGGHRRRRESDGPLSKTRNDQSEALRREIQGPDVGDGGGTENQVTAPLSQLNCRAVCLYRATKRETVQRSRARGYYCHAGSSPAMMSSVVRA